MASKKTLNAKNLEALGAERLAELLIEIGDGDAAAKRRLRMELAGGQSLGEPANEARRRLESVAQPGSFVDWSGSGAVADELEIHRRAIVDDFGKTNPKEAFDLLWTFMELASSIFERCEDHEGELFEFFHKVSDDLGESALKAEIDPETLAELAFDALNANDWGQFDNLISVLAPALGTRGLEHLKRSMIDQSNRPAEGAPDEDCGARLALMEIADIQGDVDAFTEQYDEETRKVPTIAVDIARRLLKAGRSEEALRTIEAATVQRRPGHWCWLDFRWDNARIDALDALGRAGAAQAARWECFEVSLSPSHLREYLALLPDSDDAGAEAKALDFAQGFPDLHQAVSFLVSWPALDRAANLVIRRADDLNGERHVILTEAADALAGRHPLAATLALRAVIDSSLTGKRSSLYRQASGHLLKCSSLSSEIDDFGYFETHDAYEAKLRREHGRKRSFWRRIS